MSVLVDPEELLRWILGIGTIPRKSEKHAENLEMWK